MAKTRRTRDTPAQATTAVEQEPLKPRAEKQKKDTIECPRCRGTHTYVITTFPRKITAGTNGDTHFVVRRRRQCKGCKHIFGTTEKADE